MKATSIGAIALQRRSDDVVGDGDVQSRYERRPAANSGTTVCTRTVQSARDESVPYGHDIGIPNAIGT